MQELKDIFQRVFYSNFSCLFVFSIYFVCLFFFGAHRTDASRRCAEAGAAQHTERPGECLVAIIIIGVCLGFDRLRVARPTRAEFAHARLLACGALAAFVFVFVLAFCYCVCCRGGRCIDD